MNDNAVQPSINVDEAIRRVNEALKDTTAPYNRNLFGIATGMGDAERWANKFTDAFVLAHPEVSQVEGLQGFIQEKALKALEDSNYSAQFKAWEEAFQQRHALMTEAVHAASEGGAHSFLTKYSRRIQETLKHRLQ